LKDKIETKGNVQEQKSVADPYQTVLKFPGFCDEAKRDAVYFILFFFFFSILLAFPKNPHVTKKN
jgi:hypothetical protein